MKKTRPYYLKLTLVGLTFIMSFFLGLYVYQHQGPKMPNLVHATPVKPGRMLSAFELKKTDGQPLNLSHLAGKAGRIQNRPNLSPLAKSCHRNDLLQLSQIHRGAHMLQHI